LKYGYSLNGDFSNVTERWASHISGWLKSPDTLVVRYEQIKEDCGKVLEMLSAFLGLKLKKSLKEVRLHQAPSILPRKGIIGDWQNIFTEADEIFLRQAVEQAGVAWNEVIYNDKGIDG